ncbi:hypothetical protein [Sporosarcina sp. G11-34]|uniref:hypothetical protein n=1 Tax=Sporosarcina sp. G11-34 TaxID=2849605 RepID=UPI0022A9C3F2|nr:hypothetical protein [Sporosarcina sp. G11-34]MCZ2258274.1 hypothetical protein [Sporosarcina sp. G11-34]
MRFVKKLFVTIIILVGIGYGIYYFGTNLASEKIMNDVSVELENSGYLDEIKQFVANDPELQSYIEEGANVDKNKLPFTTKEQATRVLIKKVGLSELLAIQSKATSGMTENEMLNLLNEIEGKLTDEEILALKVLAYQELNN